MTAKLVTITEAVVDELNGNAHWPLKFGRAERTYLPREELENTDNCKVSVAFSATRMQPYDRTEWVYEHDIDIGIQFRLKPNSGDLIAKFDLCLELEEQIADYWRHRIQSLRPEPNTVLMGVEIGGPSGAPYVPQHVEKFNQFTGIVRLTFREVRS